jgi:spore germination protein YaaH
MTFRSHVRTALLGIGLCVMLVVGLVGSVALHPAATGDPATGGSPSSSIALASVDPSPSPLRSDQVVHRPTEVFGFLPYWSMADWTDSYLRYDLLTTIAFFGIGVRQNGTLITSGAGYDAFMSPRAATIIEHAHAAGVRVVITFESFGASKNKKFLAKAAYRATFVAEATAFVAAHGLDGLNLDVEGLDGADRPAFGLLVGDLAGSIHAANPAAEVSVATNANVSGARMAKMALDVGADRSFLMGYAYRVASSPAVGGIAPYTGVGTSLDLVRSLDLYEVNGIAPEEIILGLPYYGMTWATTTNEMHAPRQPTSAGFGTGRAYRPRTAVGVVPPPAQTLDYDGIEQVARLTWYDATRKTWFQTYYDDPTTLAPKEQLAVDRGLAGIGLWALGDDAGQPGYWETIAFTLGLGPEYVAPSLSPSPSPSPSLSASPSVSPSLGPSLSAGPSALSSASPSPSHLAP